MFYGILHRKIFMELFQVFFIALVALTGIMLLGGIFAEATQRGLSPTQVLAVIPLLIPSSLPYTLPTTTLMATCVVFGRLANDNEILAIKAAGISLFHVVWPGLALGILTSATTFGLYVNTIPATYDILRSSIVSDIEELLYTMLKRDGCLRHNKVGYDIFVKRVEGRKLIDALFMRRDPKTRYYDVIAFAREAELHVDMPSRKVIVTMHQCHISNNAGQDEGYVLLKDWYVDLPEITSNSKDRASQLTWWELQTRQTDLSRQIEETQTDIQNHLAVVNLGNAPPHFMDHIKGLREKKKLLQRRWAEIRAELQLRPSLALGCLCFVLVGCPVGIWFSKSDYLSAFMICFLPIVVIYYPLLLCGIKFGQSGNYHPALTIWLANGVMGVISLFLFKKLFKN